AHRDSASGAGRPPPKTPRESGGDMKRRALLCLATVAALVAFLALPGAANAQHTTAGPNVVKHWNEIAASTLVAMPGPAGGAPSALQINMGMTQRTADESSNT